MDHLMALANAILSAEKRSSSEDDYYARHARQNLPRLRGLSTAPALALLVVILVVAGVGAA